MASYLLEGGGEGKMLEFFFLAHKKLTHFPVNFLSMCPVDVHSSALFAVNFSMYTWHSTLRWGFGTVLYKKMLYVYIVHMLVFSRYIHN